jgi:Fe-S-cluster containining protein
MITKDTPRDELLRTSECRRCGHCCGFGSGALADNDELKRLAKHLRISEDSLRENFLEEVERFNTKKLRPRLMRKNGMPYGSCIFLKNSLCSVHDAKPLECRIGTCGPDGEARSIWFSLNYFVDTADAESIRQWAMRLETHPTIEGGELRDLVPDKRMLKKMLEDWKDKKVDGHDRHKRSQER